MLSFPDGTRVRVNGLNEIMADLYSEGRPANKETAEKIINKLESAKNYIPSSALTRREFAFILLKEYQEYIKGRTDKKG
jgi:hypothetical protein